MTNQEILITIAIILALAYFYWQNQPAKKVCEKKLREANQLYQQKITDLDQALLNLAKQKIKNKKEAEELVQQWQEQQQALQQELATKKNWSQANLPQLKQELFAAGQETFQELQATIAKAYFVKGKGEVKSKLAELAEFFTEPQPNPTKTDELD